MHGRVAQSIEDNPCCLTNSRVDMTLELLGVRLHLDDRSLDDATGTLEIPAGRLTARRVTDGSGI